MTPQYTLLKEIRAKLETKYVEAYAAVSKVISQDDPAWPKLLVLGQQMESNKARAFCQSRNKLVAMYEDAVQTKPIFGDIFGTIAGTTNGTFTGAPPKRIFRALEKTVMKPAGHPNLDKADNVCDVIRGMIVYGNFGDMILGIEATAKHEDVVIMRTKDRYSSPTSGGWMDLVVNLSFKSDRNAHVCEIQFIHQGLLAVRKMCGGHHVYNTFRSALELLETHNALESAEVLSAKKVAALRRASVVDTSSVTAWLEENGVKTKSGVLSSVLTQLNVASVLDLASLDETDTNKVLQLMNNLQKKKWNTKEIPTKLDTCLASVIEKANGKSTVVEWLQVLCLTDSGAATWLEDNGPYEEMDDVKELEAEDEQNLVEATRMNGGAAQAARVRKALAALKGGGKEKQAMADASAAGFVVGTAVCALFGATVYDGKVTSITAAEGIVVTFSDGDVKKYTPSELKSCVQNALAAREKAAGEGAAKEKASGRALDVTITSTTFQTNAVFIL